jgi:ABC-type spermidine/putrescine transport system permease subunit II
MSAIAKGERGEVARPTPAPSRSSTLRARLERLVPLGVVPLLGYLGLVLLVPAAALALYSFFRSEFFDVERVFTLGSWNEFLHSSLYLSLLGKSLAIGLLCATLTVTLGFVMAYAMTFRLGRWGTRLLVLVMATLLASYVVRVYAWKTILGTEGILNEALIRVGLIEEPLSFLLFGYFAIVLTLVYVYLPIAVLPIYAGLQDIDRHVLEASRDLGSSPARAFWTVTVPLAAPGLRVAFAFAFVLTASDYVTPSLVGGLSGQMIGRTIADQFGGSSDYPLGAVLAIALLLGFAVVLGGLWLIARLLRRPASRLVLERSSPRGTQRGWLGRSLHRIPWSSLTTFALTAFLLAPLLVVVLFSFTESRIPGLPYRGFTLHWYGDILTNPAFHRVVKTSVIVAAIGVAGALLLGLPAARAMARRRFSLQRLTSAASYAPLVVPGIAIGVAILTACVFVGIRLGSSVAAATHVMLVVPYIVLVLRTRFATLDPRIEEAGRDLGSTPLRVFRTLTLPLVSAALVAASILAAAVSLDELIVTNFVIGGDATIPTWVLGQMRLGITPAINAIAVLLLVVPVVVLLLAGLALRARGQMRLARTLGAAR